MFERFRRSVRQRAADQADREVIEPQTNSSTGRGADEDLGFIDMLKTHSISMPRWPYHSEDEVLAVSAVLRSGLTNQWTGSKVKEFEREFSRLHEGRKTIALANGTVALELALRVLGVGDGDEVIVPSSSFVATASCVALAGAKVVFADVDPLTQLITADTIEPLISPKTRAIIVVHLHGRPCDMISIMTLAARHKLLVIEDCAQAVGARIQGRPVGVFGDAAAFSFCQDKIISTGGEGGMLILAAEEKWREAWSFKDHGKNIERATAAHVKVGYRWLHTDVGTNWRMTEVQAAIGLLQLPKLPNWIAVRTRIAARLARALSRDPCTVPGPASAGFEPAPYRQTAIVDERKLAVGWSRDRILKCLSAAGVGVLSGTCAEIYREDAFAAWAPSTPHANAQSLGRNMLAFLVHPTLDEAYLSGCEQVIDLVLEASCRERSNTV